MRYVADFKTAELKREFFDLVVVGSGLAGLNAAFAAAKSAPEKTIAVLSKGKWNESNSIKAQGGIAVPLGKDDSAAMHIRDTLDAGDGLCDQGAVKILVNGGKPKITELMELGLGFDSSNGGIDLGIEGGHSRRRVLHINGDATGKWLSEFMLKLVKEGKNTRLLQNTALAGLLTEGKRYAGCLVMQDSEPKVIRSAAVVLATGGYAALYCNSTNDAGITGEGIAAAHRAGAALADLEFVQFHPTVLTGGGENYLITESVRGEGAKIVNSKGEEFMAAYSERKELATRDIVSRAIFSEMQKGHKVFLDISGLEKTMLKERFPNLYGKIRKAKPGSGLLGIAPAAHYAIGGIKISHGCRASIAGVYAAGECSCSGVHGANRLACNSLLEAVVFGQRAGENAIMEKTKKGVACGVLKNAQLQIAGKENSLDSKAVGKILWESAGIVRSAGGLRKGIAGLGKPGNCAEKEIALLVLRSALAREESRGVHFRSDFPAKKKGWQRHSMV